MEGKRPRLRLYRDCGIVGRRFGLPLLLGGLGLVGLGWVNTACRPTPAGLKTSPHPVMAAERVTAIVGATVIDGTGAPPRQDMTVLLRGRYIAAVGPRKKLRLPRGAEVIDGRGLFVLPGFIDLNVHTGGDSKYLADALQHGVTTVHNTLGELARLRAARDSIRTGEILGARLLFSSQIIGWDGMPDSTGPTVGASLIGLDRDSLRARIDQYLDTGVDFLKYGATDHDFGKGVALQFSLAAQRVIVEEAHGRGMPVETHAITLEAARTALLAGVDLVQHAEILWHGSADSGGGNASQSASYSDDLIRLFVRHKVICALVPGRGDASPPSKADWSNPQWLLWNANRRKLIGAGCPIVPTSDALPGLRTLHSIEELVLLGMTPLEALVAATRNGARACWLLNRIGTVEAGKLADLVVIGADPLQDIKNIEQIVTVFAEGRRVKVIPHAD